MNKLSRYTVAQRKLLRRPDLVRLRKPELAKAGFAATTVRYRAPNQTIKSRRSPTISLAAFLKKRHGMTHGKVASLRAKGQYGYGVEGTERGIPKSVVSRRSHQEQLSTPVYSEEPLHAIAYINTAGAVALDYFWKKNLRIMHSYRDDVAHARYTGDGTGLTKYQSMVITTYDGTGWRNYDHKNVRVYPETSLKKILNVLASMTDLQRARFEADVNYRHLKAAA